MSSTDPEVARRLNEAAAAAKARANVPSWVRDAKDRMPAFEDAAVAAVAKWSGAVDVRLVRREAGRRSDSNLATFAAFHDLVDFPARFFTGRLLFHYDDLATSLLNSPEKTPMWSAWCDSAPAGRSALVFSWPRVRGCGQRCLCVFHNCERDDTRLAGFRLMLPIRGGVYSIEPLPGFLRGISRWAADAREEADGGPQDED